MPTNTDDHQTISRPATARLSQEVLDQWRAEAHEFFSNAKRKLREIRDADDAARQPLSPTPPTHTESLAHPENRPGAMQESPALTDRPTEERAPAVDQVSQAVADDSLDRLQAIKRRLAAQLENSRS